jgi:hypothetical protein
MHNQCDSSAHPTADLPRYFRQLRAPDPRERRLPAPEELADMPPQGNVHKKFINKVTRAWIQCPKLLGRLPHHGMFPPYRRQPKLSVCPSSPTEMSSPGNTTGIWGHNMTNKGKQSRLTIPIAADNTNSLTLIDATGCIGENHFAWPFVSDVLQPNQNTH